MIGASRTDSGVHAFRKCSCIRHRSRIPGEKMAKALMQDYQKDIIIQDSKEVPLDYHPRFRIQERHMNIPFTMQDTTIL